MIRLQFSIYRFNYCTSITVGSRFSLKLVFEAKKKEDNKQASCFSSGGGKFVVLVAMKFFFFLVPSKKDFHICSYILYHLTLPVAEVLEYLPVLSYSPVVKVMYPIMVVSPSYS